VRDRERKREKEKKRERERWMKGGWAWILKFVLVWDRKYDGKDGMRWEGREEASQRGTGSLWAKEIYDKQGGVKCE
jgi:hypothetical protein